MNQEYKAKSLPSDFFLHLGIIVALYISAVSLISLLYSIINKVFPDTLYYSYDASAGSIRFAVAALIIMFPLYLYLGWLYDKQLRADPEKKSLGIRKWLVYFTLFIAGLTMAIDLIFLVYTLLGGEITVRFILKALSVFAVAGIIFSYYLTDVRRDAVGHSKLMRTYGLVALVFVLAAVITGFVVVGTPAHQRKLQFDQQRIYDLQSIQWQIVNYYQQKGNLPATLTDLEDPISSFMVPRDPETKTPYEYKPTAALGFELCADFDTALNNQPNESQPLYPRDAYMKEENWQHGVGRACFNRTIDPELYPIREKSAAKTSRPI